MGIRIKCDLPAFPDTFVEFRDRPWKFGDRRRTLEAGGDAAALEIILPYVVEWNVKDCGGNPVDAKAGVDMLDDVEDGVVIWLIRAWFEARLKATQLPPN
uniref:Uncharacterized protein n=1 Tax=viral metagenome TaxID=1070528 RepID=A0A6M3KKR1_9ZZZZ